LAWYGGRGATVDRDLDARELAGVAGSSGPSILERCPATEWLTFSRAVQAGDEGLLEVSAGSPCMSRFLLIALRRHGRAWFVEGDYSQAVPGGLPGCGQAYRAAEAPAGRYLLVES
jgi:hypothetical protein